MILIFPVSHCAYRKLKTILYPEEACKRPEALEETFDRVEVERLWTPRNRLVARVARDKVVKR